MRQSRYGAAGPYDGHTQVALQPGPFGPARTAGAWQSEVSRGSPEYVRWVQQTLNRVLGLRLAEDGLLGRRTRSAIRSFQQRQGLAVDGVVGPQTEAALAAASRTRPPGSPTPGATPAAPRIAPGGLAQLRANIVRVANQEWQRWNAGGRKFERDPRMRPILHDYWQTGAGRRVNAADLGSEQFQADHPWSAAFISWVMRQAGAGDAFKYSAAHAAYIVAAKNNRLANNSNPFKAYRISEVRPQPGDLVCKSRAGSGATYDNIRVGHKTHCDVVTEVRPGQLVTIGGNVSNSVSQTRVATDANGIINDPRYFAVIKVGAPLVGAAPAR